MKPTNYIVTIFLASGMLISNIVSAQNDNAPLTSYVNSAEPNPVPESFGTAIRVADEKPVNTISLLKIDEKNKTIRLNKSLPDFTSSAVLLVQDFTGRTLKTFTVNLHNTMANEFNITDLLPGTYNYSVLLDNQKKINGEFSVKN